VKFRTIGLWLTTVGLILIVSGLALGSTERIIIERHSWQPADRSFVIPPRSYVAIQFNGTRTYTYSKTLWQPETRSTWSYDHHFSWNVTVKSGHVNYWFFNERAFKAWAAGDPEYALIKGMPTGGFGANGSSPPWRWWIEDPGNPYIVLINNRTTAATVRVHVGERWPQFRNQNIQDGFNVMILGLGVTVAGTMSWAWGRKART